MTTDFTGLLLCYRVGTDVDECSACLHIESSDSDDKFFDVQWFYDGEAGLDEQERESPDKVYDSEPKALQEEPKLSVEELRRICYRNEDITRGANDLARVLNTPVLSYLILCAGCRKVSVHYT
ncbi:unnamed protein product [Toxocara canis]|uniref:Uncharacterized protein n=1 Tax=Toxocara canis TaxID=6265 RepID=A0A3P7H4M3_TOXCA|nr:unnamed protein product [Toxocara canis]